MRNKSIFFLGLLQLIVAILAVVVLIKFVKNNGNISMIIVAFLTIIIGGFKGYQNIRLFLKNN